MTDNQHVTPVPVNNMARLAAGQAWSISFFVGALNVALILFMIVVISEMRNFW